MGLFSRKPKSNLVTTQVTIDRLDVDEVCAIAGYPPGERPQEDVNAEWWWVAGVEHRQDLLRQMYDTLKANDISADHLVMELRPETGNPYDRHAIAVHLFTMRIGFVPARANLSWMHGRIRNQYGGSLPVYGMLNEYDEGKVGGNFFYRTGSLR